MGSKSMGKKQILAFVVWLILFGLASCRQDEFKTTPNIIEIDPSPKEEVFIPTVARLPGAPPSPTARPTIEQINTPLNEVQHSPTPVPTIEDVKVRFAVIGDFGLAGQPAADVAELVKSWKPNFIITTGDNNYPYGEAETIDENIGQYYAQYIYPYQGVFGRRVDTNRFFPTPGNHDWDTDELQPYLEYFTLPGKERYYDFSWGPVHLFSIDGDSREPDGVSSNSLQANWLRQSLSESTATWKIVYMHQPPYSSGYHGSVEWMRWPFKSWGASAVFAGHDHIYERLLVDDLPYFVNGLGGGPRYLLLLPLPGSQVRYQKDHGAMLVEATDNEITFQFITRLGEIIDSYSMTKSD